MGTDVVEAARFGIAGSAKVIDSHVHVWPPSLIHGGQKGRTPLAATTADLVATLDGSVVDVALASPANVYRHNAYVLGAANAVPQRMLAVVGIDPTAADEIAAIPAHARHGAVAVRVNFTGGTLRGEAGLAGLDRLVDATASEGLVLQWTMPLPEAHLIERASARQPRLRQIFDHLGLPPDARDLAGLARVAELAAIPNVHMKLSGMYALSRNGYPYEDVWPWMEGVVAAFGPERILWASDWPLSSESASHADLLALVRRLPFLDAAATEHVLSGTAKRLWPLRK